MTEHFYDMMRNRLNSHESPVPQDMFDNISGRLNAIDQSFDAAVNNHLANYASAVPASMFDGINTQMEAYDTKFDTSVSSRLHHFDSPVPADMWQRIMHKKEKRRPVFWWWAAALLLAILGVGSINYVNQPNANNIIASNNKAEQKKTTATNERNKPKKVTNPGLLNTVEAVTVDEPASQKRLLNPGIINTGNKTNGYSNIGGGFISSFRKTILKNQYKNNSDLLQGNNNEGAFLPANEIAVNSTLPIENSIAEKQDQQLAFRKLIRSSFNKLLPLQLLQANVKTPIIPCPMNGDEPRNDWYIDVYASPMMVVKNVSDNVAGKNIRPGMDSTLHKQVSFNAGMNLVKNVGEHFLVKAGVQYNQVNDVFRNTRVNEIKLITTISIRTVIIAPGDTIYIRDTSVIQQVGTVTRQNQNRYKSWDIPVIIGYEFGGKDLKINANVGVIANIRSSYSGNMLDTTQQTINIADYKTTGVYQTNVGFGLYAGVAVVKSIGERTEVLIEPHARCNLTNTTTDAAWFKQKNIVAGISFGIRYKLNSKRQR